MHVQLETHLEVCRLKPQSLLGFKGLEGKIQTVISQWQMHL